MTAPVLREDQGAVAILRLNRPDRLNAVNLELYERLAAALTDIRGDDRLRCVVITGSGRAFSVGADLKAHGEGERTADEKHRYVEVGQSVYRTIQTFPKPVVAAINGHAIGAGLELALSCDLLCVYAGAKLRFPELYLGTFVGGGTIYTLRERVGAGRARRLMLLGEMFLGREAVDMGLADDAVDETDAVLVRALAWAQRLVEAAPVSMAHARRLLDAVRALDPETAMREEGRALLACMDTADWKEGLEAFEEGRPPVFGGR